jgi:hypothetical protein
VVALVAFLGLAPFAFVREFLPERRRWYNPLAWLLAALLALPFLVIGLVFFLLALGVKFLVYLTLFATKCPTCGRRQWRVSNYGILDFLSIHWGQITGGQLYRGHGK